MTTTQYVARLATTSEASGVAAAISRGFSTDPVLRWMFPDDETYAEYSTRFFRLQTELALETGYVWTTDGLVGGLLVYRFDELKEAREDPAYFGRLAEACGPYAERALAYESLGDDTHPPGVVQLYGAYIGVDPAHYGGGVGSQLERAWTDLADDVGLPCYGEASSPDGLRFHKRHGFEALGETQIVLPADDKSAAAPLTPIWREPQPR